MTQTATPTATQNPQPDQTADIVLKATVTHVYCYPLSQKARDAGVTDMRAREEYSDTVREYVNRMAREHGLTVDRSKDW